MIFRLSDFYLCGQAKKEKFEWNEQKNLRAVRITKSSPPSPESAVDPQTDFF